MQRHIPILSALFASVGLIAACGTSDGPELGRATQALACGVDEDCSLSATPLCNGGACVADTCGNGKTYAANEQCDDGANVNGDGCSDTCQVEPGYTCSGQPSVCAIVCGDGVLAANEQCDDGNATDGDGCSANCKVEAGFVCGNPKSSAFYTRKTNSECFSVPDFEAGNNTPPGGIPAAYAVPGLTVWGSYRARHVAGAGDFADHPTAWRAPTIIEWDSGNGTKTRMFGGFTNPGQTSRKKASAVADAVSFDFALATANSIRATVPDTACGNNDDAPITYRIDSMSICTPVCVTPNLPAGGTCVACTGDLNDGAATAACGGIGSPYCASNGSCGKCTSNADCAGHKGGAICNASSGACGTACTVDVDCADAKKWCDNASGAAGAGTCVAKTANGSSLPATAPINGLCTQASGARVCASGVCDTDNKCGLLDGKTCTGSDAQSVCRTKCTSGICGECATDKDCPTAKPVCDVKVSKCGTKAISDAGVDGAPDAATPKSDAGTSSTSSSTSSSGSAQSGGALEGGGVTCSAGPASGRDSFGAPAFALGLLGLVVARRGARKRA